MNWIKRLFFLLLPVLVLFSCATERRLAQQFVQEETNINVLLLPPPDLIVKYYPTHPDEADPDTIDAYDLQDARFVDEVDDSLVVNNFMQSLKYHLELFQVNVFGPDNIDSFFRLDTTAFIFSLSQMELMEYLDEAIFTSTIDTIQYLQRFPQTTLMQSHWFEFSTLNQPEKPMEVLYSMQYTSDYFDGRFVYNPLSGEVTFRYTPYYLTSDDVFELAYFAGEQNAQYIFDYLMNYYVREEIASDTDRYFTYDRNRHVLRPAYNDRFIRISNRENRNEQGPQ